MLSRQLSGPVGAPVIDDEPDYRLLGLIRNRLYQPSDVASLVVCRCDYEEVAVWGSFIDLPKPSGRGDFWVGHHCSPKEYSRSRYIETNEFSPTINCTALGWLLCASTILTLFPMRLLVIRASQSISLPPMITLYSISACSIVVLSPIEV